MNERRQFISDLYHFIGEMIIVSIIVLLPIHFYYDWIPMWSILVVAIPLCVVFTLLEKKGVDYKLYYFVVPLLVIIFLMLQFPIIISIPISVIIIWRYLRIRQHFLRGREASCMLLTAMLSIVVYITTAEQIAIGYLFLQIFVLVFGFMFSHVAVTEKTKRTLSIYKVGIYFVIFLFIGALIAFWISTQSYIERVFDKVIYVIFSIFGRVLYLFDFLEPSDFEKLFEAASLVQEESEFKETGELGLFQFAFSGYLILGFITAFIGLIVVLKVFKRDASRQEGFNGKVSELGIVSGHFDSYEKVTRSFKKWRTGKKHPVRIMVHEFERKAIKSKIGRRQSETIGEWFNRIGLQVNVDVYQKVRYGNMDVSGQEIEALKIGLEKIIRSLHTKNKT